MNETELKFKNITFKIIGCAMEVHRNLGNGFQEIIYQRALAKELDSNGLDFGREVDMPIIYKCENIGTRRVDFLIDGKIMVEIKALSKIEPEHFVQIKNYLECTNLEIGLLLNFGAKSLEYKRIFNNKHNPENQK